MSQFRFKYKLALKVLVIFIFAVPVLWIVLDPSGQRWADVTLLRILGNPSINMDFSGLSGNESVEDMRKIYPKLELSCSAKGPEAVLNQDCLAKIAAINELPARYLAFNFRDGRLNRVKISYRAAYHEMLYGQLSTVYGQPQVDKMGGLENQIVKWQTGPGMVIMKAVVSKKDDNQLFWVTPGYEAASNN